MISMDKKYVTRDGREVRIYAVGVPGVRPVHGARKTDDDNWCIDCWSADGRHGGYGDSTFDLLEVRPKITRTYWLIQQRGNYAFYSDVDPRGRRMNSEIIAITGPHTVEFQEGDGL